MLAAEAQASRTPAILRQTRRPQKETFIATSGLPAGGAFSQPNTPGASAPGPSGRSPRTCDLAGLMWGV
jgi:hypothetical protein